MELPYKWMMTFTYIILYYNITLLKLKDSYLRKIGKKINKIKNIFLNHSTLPE